MKINGITLNLVYIGEHSSRFIYGKTYEAFSFTKETTTFLDSDGIPMVFLNDTLHNWFRQKDHLREEKIDRILSK